VWGKFEEGSFIGIKAHEVELNVGMKPIKLTL
jgi:hypothetical protein